VARHKTNKARSSRQKLKERYSKAREDAQLHGLISTTPEGALKDEVVPSSLQEDARLPEVDRMAITKGWAVPEGKKQLVISRLLEPFENPVSVTRVTDAKGNEQTIESPIDPNILSKNARVLVAADQRQWERDHPEEAGKAKGKLEVNVGVGVTINDPYQLYKQALEEVAKPDEIEGEINAITTRTQSNGAPSTTESTRSSPSAGQDVLAGGEALPTTEGDDKLGDRERRDLSSGSKSDG
jgi:hypothetical protein